MTKGCVLVVDDSPDMREAVRDLLISEGYLPILAVDGPSALEKLTQLVPDLIITDLMMPGMDGIELMVRISRLDSCQGVPFILMTGTDVQVARLRAQEQGLECQVVSKPLNLQDFLALIVGAVIAGHHQRRAEPEVSRAASATGPGRRERR